MTHRVKKYITASIRLAICAAALWLVARGVTYHDRITLSDDQGELIGTVLTADDPAAIEQSDGQVIRVSHARIAREEGDEDGELLIAYGLKSAVRNSRVSLLILAALIIFPVVFLQGVRLRWMLKAQSIDLSWWACVKMSLAGNFLNFATPLGSNAGDVFKAYFVALHTDKKTEAATTIFLDRIVGLSSLLLVVVVITTLSPANSRLTEFRPYVLGVCGVGLAGVLLYLSPMIRRRLVPWSWLMRLKLFEQLQRIDNTARTLLRHHVILAASVLITVLLQATAMAGYFTVAVAVGMDAHWGNLLEYYAYFYIGSVIQALPGPPQGLGTVELAYRYFLAPFGSPSQIICVALLVRVVVLICSIPGSLIALTGAYKPGGGDGWRAARVDDQSSRNTPDTRLTPTSTGEAVG